MSQPVLRREASSSHQVVPTDDGAKLAVTVHRPNGYASGATVLLSHGWAAGRAGWRPVTRRLLDLGHTVVAYDQRGHGESSLGSEPIAIPRLGNDLASILAQADADGVILVGHSGGGFAALSYAIGHAADARRRLRGLALLATAAHDQDTKPAEVRMMGSGLFSSALSLPALGRRMLRQTMGTWVNPAALETHRRLFAATPGPVRAACFSSTRGMDQRPGLRTITCPTVVLAGDSDTVIAPKLGQAVADAIPQSRYELLPGAGHMLPLERPGRIAAVIDDLVHSG
ncbi:alpha/beta hydrolase [Natronosporangium hydrolyticum]|uniref:Alpha/beta hydrolase n=1 Tax=Natronosporangium hydrolyticum TaxID=2811111 RepID=A0A895YLB0_9ACTN|nr:alpha/beta hydrolase [Natronosporangium hydrolyticum]QSB16772.1 alpha/beta hydrolase [Natronosporangium hydrolyticum]